VLDTGRAAAAELDLPVVNCPTVVATDAPTSALSVIYTDAGVFDSYRFYKRNPELVLVDTQVIANSPPRLFVAGMGDALSTWFEARSCSEARKNHSRGGQTTLAALALARLCYDTIVADGYDALCAVRERAVTPAMERVTEANTLLSGLGFESSGLAAAHSVHNGLTAADGTHDYFHGEKVAFGTLTQLVLEGQSGEAIEEVLGFCVRVGLPVTLGQIGVENASDELLHEVATRATAPGETIHNEPFAVKADMVVDALRTADALGKAFLARGGRAH
jgi:glycerol dehydrogenase